MDIVFLGLNNVGYDIYEWLCDREDTQVQALLTTKDQLSLIEDVAPDCVVASGFSHVVPPEILSIPPEGCINIHPGYLPHARGYNPNVWHILEETTPGVTMHYMDDSIDTGDIIARRAVTVDFSDTGRTLYERLETACYELFTETWPSIEQGTVEGDPQDETQARHHRKQEFQDLCELDVHESATVKELLDRLRALTFEPFHNAHVEIEGDRYYVDIDVTHESDTTQDQTAGLLSSYQ